MLNLLDHPISLKAPLRLAASEWAEHVPFALFLVDILRPGTIVELGTFSGVSYCAFCQAVAELALDCRCYAVDNWKGDPQSGFFGPEILQDLRTHHDPLYSGFSTLIQSTFDEALNHFTDGSIELLHIDGYHAYESVKHDFDNWLPKMSTRGVVLFHDTNERHDDFGVWRLWNELKARYPHFEFLHGHGLGVLAVGSTYPEELRDLFAAKSDERVLVRELFHGLGERLSARLEAEHADKALSWHISDKEHITTTLSAQLSERDSGLVERDRVISDKEQAIADKEQVIATLSTQLSNNERIIVEKEQSIARLSAQLSQQENIISERDKAIAWLQDELNQAGTLLEDSRTKTLSLSADLAFERGRTANSEARLVEQAEKSEQIITAREEGIAWLRNELADSRKELADSRTNNRVLSGQLSARAEQLARITNSLGWRCLSWYGRIKYRYLLPLYRPFGAISDQSKRAGETTPSETRAATPPPIVPPGPRPAQDFIEPVIDAFLSPTERVEEKAKQNGFLQALSLLPHPRDEELQHILNEKPASVPRHRHDVICFSIIDWDSRYQRPQQIMSQFAAHGHRVFYLSPTRNLPDDSTPRFQVRLIKNNLYEVELSAPWPPDVYREVIDGTNKSALLNSLEELRQTFHVNEAISYVMISSWTSVVLEARERFGWRVIYDCMDEWENFPGIKRALLEAESQLVQDCDLLIVTGQRLYEKWQEHNRPTVVARNAVDLDFYAEHYVPNDLLSGCKPPVIGYYGAIADWFDFELMAYVARQRPDYTFVLLGGIFGVFDVDIKALKALPNVRLLGQQPYETMPKYLYHFDACMIPFKINPITEATDPVKLYEYLSAGKPVVTVALPEVTPYREYVYVAKDRDDFAKQLDRAVSEENRDLVNRRISFAREQTWGQRYQGIEAGLSSVTPRATIVVVTYNNLALNKLCLESILRNTDYPNYEVMVVDNNSTDGTHAYLRYMAAQYSHVNVILNSSNAGFARANNQGITQSNGEYIVLLNNDTIVPPGWLSRLLRHLKDQAIGLVGPVTNFAGNEAKIDVPYQTLGEMEDFAREYTWKHDGQSAEIKVLAMFCVAFRRETYELIGPLDEQFGIGMFEDDDYTQRIKAAGLRVICAADVFVHHFGQAAFKKLIENGQYNEIFDENRRRYEAKWNIEWIPHQHGELEFALSQVRSSRKKTITNQ